ncbi:ubiquitin carboxyl-terminal hydrolase 47 isoform X2 [Eurosta solidaginis]|uniref:ubiquitin carboxyl-terminal hydrolase 47 isoform X2 n=1 Tax=Eurosta solidaginis TaxID=178769 RepID=UPI00353141DB
MEQGSCSNMVQLDYERTTQCVVHDLTPGSEQKKINIVVRAQSTVGKVFRNISTQYPYEAYDLILQPNEAESPLIHLNSHQKDNLFSMPGFAPEEKNVLVLLPPNTWDGDVKQRFDFAIPATKKKYILKSPKKETTTTTTKTKTTTKSSITGRKASKSPTTTNGVDTTVDNYKESAMNGDSADALPKNSTIVKNGNKDALDKIQKDQKDVLVKSKKDVLSKSPEKVAAKSAKHALVKNSEDAAVKSSKNALVKSSEEVAAQSSKEALIKNSENYAGKSSKNALVKSSQEVAPTSSKEVLIENSEDAAIKSSTDTLVKSSEEVAGKSSKDALVINSKDDASVKTNNNENLTTNNGTNHVSGGGDASTTIAEQPTHIHTAAATSNTVTTTAAATTLHSLKLSPLSDPELLSDDDLALGASASPTETEPSGGDGLLKIHNTSPRSPKYGPLTEGEMHQQITLERDFTYLGKKLQQPTSASALTTTTATSAATTMPTMCTSTANGYVGLVNQAMTCYLNSLLQALFMTPEFRNALYRWEADSENEAKNIPYQLQKLFLNLQTSKKSAVETTDLTRSFGWDSTQAWQQHDIQELCRVMFDALEQKFKNTKQMHLIANLYEGKMIDYVKCLECNTEKTRADTFLDIPLPVRPFGSAVAYGSIEEALRAFVQPETLDGNNQYFCEKCEKKCDAHKGLKFKNFPYILTLHLKRFDFDYQTMHRIKLNDKVTFPQTLNLNSFINPADKENHTPGASGNTAVNANGGPVNTNGFIPNGAVTSNDDCSTTDSGSAMEEDLCCSGTATTASSSQHENDINDDDEGIDMSTSTDHRVTSSNASVEQRVNYDNGPYLYELFAIMIHSGSASGGHYYAYIKEFDNNEWYCFNDQSVSPITEEDIEKSFGGGSSRAYYSSVYSSSTNAYMLMYRQIDAQRNEKATRVTDFPDHINSLLPKLHQEEETRITRSSGRHGVVVSDLSVQELIKPRVTFYNPDLKKMKSTRVYVSTFNVNSILESAYQMLNVEKFAPLSCCRLVVYDDMGEQICQSLEHINDPSLSDLRQQTDGNIEFLLETRKEGQEFEVYKPGGVTWNVYLVNVWKMQLDGPHLVYAPTREANSALLHSIAMRFNLSEDQLLLATVKTDAFVAQDTAPSKGELPEGMQQQQVITQEDLQEIAQEQFRGLTHIYLNVPNTDPTTLEILGIPALETPTIEVSSDVVDAVQMNSNAMPSICPSNNSDNAAPSLTQKNCLSSGSARESPLLSATTITGQESNSEDSSLSDGDRTLVESINNRYGGESQISSTSHSPYLSSPEDDAYNKANSLKRIHDLFQMAPDGSTDNTSHLRNNNTPQFFYAEKLNAIDLTTIYCSSPNDANEELARKPTHAYKIIVDPHMKMQTFMRHVESLICVPSNYFKLQHKYEVIDLTSTILFVSPGETLSIELGKVLQPDEHKAKISFMRLSELDNDTGKLPCICEWVYKSSMTAGEAKKDLIAKLHRIDAQKYKTLTLNNCRIWLKGGRNPIKIMSDDETLGTDLRSSVSAEFLVQECEDGVKPQVGEDSLTIFVRRWYADKLQLDRFQEITLEKNSEIREELAKITNIPQEHIAYSKINGSFPCTNISLLSINSTLSWFSIPATLDKYPLTTTVNGNVYFYKDVKKAPKEPTTEERRELSNREKLRLDRLGCMSTSLYSPRRERALKIYLDSPQSNNSSSTKTTSSFTTSSAVAGASTIKSADD